MKTALNIVFTIIIIALAYFLVESIMKPIRFNQEKDAREANYHRIERSYGAFQRTFTLPSGVKSDKIEAAYTDGILSVTLPKAEEARAKEIEVRVK